MNLFFDSEMQRTGRLRDGVRAHAMRRERLVMSWTLSSLSMSPIAGSV